MNYSQRCNKMRMLCGDTKDKIVADLGAETIDNRCISDGMKGKIIKLGLNHGDDFFLGINLSSSYIDIAIAGDVMEHLENPEFFLTEIYRILKPNGLLVISVPNSASLKNRFRCLLGMSIMNGAYGKIIGDGHLSSWNMGELCRVISKTGFHIVEKGSTFSTCCIVKAVK